MKNFALKLWGKLNLPTNFQLAIMRRLNDQFLLGVTGIFFNDEGEILLFKHSYRDQDKWSLPGGYIKAKEHPKEGLEREIKEESGFTVSADERLKIRTDRKSARLDMTYVGKFIGGSFTPSKEITEAGFFSFKNLPLLTNDQLYFIEKALQSKSIKYNGPKSKVF